MYDGAGGEVWDFAFLRRFVVGAHVLADVAAEGPLPCCLGFRFGEFCFLFYGEVADTFSGVEDAGTGEGLGGAGVEAAGAVAAGAGSGRVGLDFGSGQDLCEQCV